MNQKDILEVENISILLKKGFVNKLESLLQKQTRDRIHYLLYLASDEDEAGILSYAYVTTHLSKVVNDPIFIHKLARDIMSNSLCHLQNAYQIAYMHAKKIIELIPNSVIDLENLIDIGSNRGRFLDNEEIISIANKIGEIDKNNLTYKIYSKAGGNDKNQ